MKIALDVMGGDNAPDINVDGAKRALRDFPLIEKIYLVGREETVRSSCDRLGPVSYTHLTLPTKLEV